MKQTHNIKKKKKTTINNCLFCILLIINGLRLKKKKI